MTATRRKRLQLAGALTLVLSGTACGGLQTTSAASCTGPYLNDQLPSGAFRGPARTVSPGDTLTIYGHWYTSTCNDTGGHDPLQPLRPVHLTLHLPDGSIEPLGRFTPSGPDMGFATTVHIPAGSSPGTATVDDGRKYPATYKFEIKK